MRLNKSELVVGAVVGGAMVFFIKWWILVTVPLCAFLWALGGSEAKIYRRAGCSAIAEIIMMTSGVPLLFHGLMFWVFVLATSIGYGIPTSRPFDEGSALGRFWYRRLMRERYAALATRATISLVLAAGFLPLAWINLPGYLYGAGILILGATLAGVFVQGDIYVG